jgi:hypothetical protein
MNEGSIRNELVTAPISSTAVPTAPFRDLGVRDFNEL